MVLIKNDNWYIQKIILNELIMRKQFIYLIDKLIINNIRIFSILYAISLISSKLYLLSIIVIFPHLF